MWFWMVCLPGQSFKNNILWNSYLCFSIDLEGKIVWWENRYLVFGNNDVRDDGGRESLQDHKGIVVDKDSEGWDQYSIVCVRESWRSWFSGQMFEKEPWGQSGNKIAVQTRVYNKQCWEVEGEEDDLLIDIHYYLFWWSDIQMCVLRSVIGKLAIICQNLIL